MLPKVSVLIAFYNSEAYLKKCMDSVLNQTLKEIEIIAVNDGATDGTEALLSEYAKTDDRIIIVNQQNKGLAVSRKAALSHASGEYISFIDGDDCVDLDMYEVLYSNGIRNDLDIVQCNFYPEGDEDGWKEVENRRTYSEEVMSGDDLLALYLNREVMPALWQRIFRRSMLAEFKAVFPVMSDHFNFPEWAAASRKVKIIIKPYYHWLTRKGSLGQPMGRIHETSAKNRFVSGISILAFSKLREKKYRGGIQKYLMSYVTQTAYHLKNSNSGKAYDNVVGIWKTLDEKLPLHENAMSLGLDEGSTKFFELLNGDSSWFREYVEGDFLGDMQEFINGFRYNGDDLFFKTSE